MTGNAKLLQEWYDRVWQQGDISAIDTLMRSDITTDGLVPGMQIGPDEFKLLVATLGELIYPPVIKVEKTMEDGDWVSGFITMQAEPRDRATPFTCTAMTFVRFENGRIVEAYNTMDFIRFFESLGLLPADTVALLLSGQPLQ